MPFGIISLRIYFQTGFFSKKGSVKMTTTEKNKDSSFKEEPPKSNKTPNNNYIPTSRPQHAAPKKDNTLIVSLLWETIRKHALTIATAIITLIESLSLILNMFSIPGEEQSTVGISSKMIFPLFLYIIAVIIAVISLIICIVIAMKEYRRNSRTVFSEFDKDKIDEYLSDFIESGESVVVLSHDMSWINNSNRAMLKQKARNHELHLFLPHETEEVKELEKLGAEVRYFQNIIGDPITFPVRSRMTLINWNKVYTKLTYPTKKDGLHINYEFSAGEPANQLAQDLINLLTFVSEKGTGEESLDYILNEYIRYSPDELYVKLSYQDRVKIQNWYNNYSKSGGFSCQNAFSLMRELLRYEDIDLKPDEEFTRIKEYICREYGIIPNSFLKMYSDFRKMLQI